jgi:hypothetical protein
MKVKTLRAYLIGLPEEFDDFYVKMTKHEFPEGVPLKRSVESIHGTIARFETKEVFLLDGAGADFFDNIGKEVEQKLK